MDISQVRGKTFTEQAAVPITLNAVVGSETTVLALQTANTRYILRSLRLVSVDPGANTIHVRLYELINAVLTNVVTYDITTLNYDAEASLMDMFGQPSLAGDNIKVTVQTTAGTYAITGSYSYGLSA